MFHYLRYDVPFESMAYLVRADNPHKAVDRVRALLTELHGEAQVAEWAFLDDAPTSTRTFESVSDFTREVDLELDELEPDLYMVGI